MIKSNIAIGQMFIQFEPTYMDKPKVWVKIKSEVFGSHYGEDAEEVSLFVDNNAVVKFSINPNYRIGITEKWSITDTYYGKCVREGKFIPVDDLAKTDDICEQAGWPAYEIDFEF